ncbi:TetR family transcriptional regulator [Saxibacter everestensis]|uniref:TetR family transcriptional regulator n=1 Tax=Saxibacter everestensis TaxID=2909229 RepID=A0ABY8QQY9_9MICO|nr:TetR family transcriptional regulator [Brevibacteriaceae bacterium ZFBP1038]
MVVQTRGAGRPEEAVLDRALIVDTAYQLLRELGVEDLTMARLARELGVKTPSLYNHVASKAALLNDVRGRVVAQIDTSVFDSQPWDRALRHWAQSYVAAFATLHPSSAASIAVLPMEAEPATMRMYDRVSRNLLASGWPAQELLPILVAVESFVVGSVLDIRAPDSYMAPRGDGAEPFYRRVFDARPANRAAVSVDVGLNALIAGLSQRYADLGLHPSASRAVHDEGPAPGAPKSGSRKG